MNQQTPTTPNAPSLQHMAMISTLHISMIGISNKDQTATDRANKFLQTSDMAGYYSKCKISRDDIRPVLQAAQNARNYRRKVTRPWGQNDTRLLPSSDILDYVDAMDRHKHAFEDAVLALQRNWLDIIDSQRQRLGPLFNIKEYPAQHEVLMCFGFDQELLPIPDGSHIVLDLERKMIDKLKRQLEKENQKRLERSMGEMWQRLYEPIKNMAYICSEDKAVYKSLTANMEEAVDVLQRLNITNDQKFNDMIAEINQRLVGFTPLQIRKNKKLKEQLGSAATDISAKLEMIMKGAKDDATPSV